MNKFETPAVFNKDNARKLFMTCSVLLLSFLAAHAQEIKKSFDGQTFFLKNKVEGEAPIKFVIGHGVDKEMKKQGIELDTTKGLLLIPNEEEEANQVVGLTKSKDGKDGEGIIVKSVNISVLTDPDGATLLVTVKGKKIKKGTYYATVDEIEFFEGGRLSYSKENNKMGHVDDNDNNIAAGAEKK